jgi:acetate kinase
MADAVMALNAGSSSIKFGLFEIRSGVESTCVAKGEVDGIGTAPHFVAKDAKGAVIGEQH